MRKETKFVSQAHISGWTLNTHQDRSMPEYSINFLDFYGNTGTIGVCGELFELARENNTIKLEISVVR